MWPHLTNERLDRVEDARHPTERQRRRAESHDFTVLGRPIPANDVNGIAGGVDAIEGAIEPLEGLLHQKEAIGMPLWHISHRSRGVFSGALYSASAMFGTPKSTIASIRS